MNNIIFKSLLFYIFLFLIKKVNYEIKFLKNRLFNRILYRKKIKSFENFIQGNIKFWRTKPRSYSEKKILICNFISIPGDTIINCIIGKYLEEKYKMTLVGFCNKKKTVSKLVNSYNIEKNIFLEKKNFFFKIKIFLKSIYFLNKIKTINKLYQFKLNKVFIGKIVIDHIARHTGQNLIDHIDFKVFFHFYEALYVHYLFLNIIKNQNVKIVVHSETQFIPCGIIFQNCLNNKIKLFAREGSPNWISNTIYSKYDQIYTATDEIDENLFNFTKKNLQKKASREGFHIIKNRFNKKDKVNEWIISTKKNKSKKQTYFSRKELCKKFSWNEKKKIICIFAHTLADKNFGLGKRLFKSNLHWLQTTLKTIAKNKSVNFLIKPHPQEGDYKTATSTIKEFNKLGALQHVKLIPKNISRISLSKIIDVLISSHGTAPVEYACYGIPSLVAGRCKFNYLDFFILPKKVSIYQRQIMKIQQLKKLKKYQIEDAKIFAYLIYKLIKIRCPLVPYFKWSDAWFDYNSYFWKVDCLGLLKKYDEKKDYFKQMLFYQIDNKKRNMINLKLMNSKIKI